MDKSAIKNYAVAARRKLIEAVRQKAFQLYIFEDGALPPDEAYNRLRADGIFLTPEQDKARLRLCNELAVLGNSLDNKAAYQHVTEEVAYTWFNRLIALRFMEVNEYLPSGIRILSSLDKGRIEPDAMREAERLDYVDQKKIAELRADTTNNASEKLYKYILISQCNALSAILPGMFERLGDYTELLLPDALYTKGGIVHDLVNAIIEEDFRDQVQIIGWLYQYYISEKKDEVFAALKKNVKINKETIPAATQLFTPEWIVKYMVENSLGRLWLESHPNEELKNSWKYYVEEAEQEPEVAEQLRVLRAQSPVKRPEDIKLIDPCMGSGHILVYAFDVLYQIYQSQGYAEREIPNLILQHNIYGLDIDDRAGQLAYFALMMKARSYNRRFFRQDAKTEPNVIGINSLVVDPENMTSEIHSIFDVEEFYVNLVECGSLTRVDNNESFAAIYRAASSVEPVELTLDNINFEKDRQAFLVIAKIGYYLTSKYDVVVTNPPYMGSGGMSSNLSEYLRKEYPDSKSDMSTVFMEKALEMCKPTGLISMINIPVWMFISSYEKLRRKILAQNTIINMLHFGRGIFGSDFGSTGFVIGKQHNTNYKASYRKLFPKQGAVDSVERKEQWFFDKVGEYYAKASEFSIIPSSPIAYWVSNSMLMAFQTGKLLGTMADSKQGLATADNDRFLRLWHEVFVNKTEFNATSIENAEETSKKWFPYNKGGEFRKWYGNNDYIVNWENNGSEIRNFKDSNGKLRSRPQNTQYYFQECFSWSLVSSGVAAFRYKSRGHIFDVAGMSCFTKDNLLYLLALCNTNIVMKILEIIAPTINYQCGDIANIPVIYSIDKKEWIEKNASKNIDLSRIDWDSFEISWDFQTHPLVLHKIESDLVLTAKDEEDATYTQNMSLIGWTKNTVEGAYKKWAFEAQANFAKLKSNEEELNRIFIEIYGLQDELTPEVEDKDVTIRKADLGRDIRSFLSYAVGCMFGRYSLDEPGLVYAGGQFEPSRYKTFLPEDDNIIPIGSADYFDDDIVVRFTEFVRKVYGDETLNENLNFIADALYPTANGSAKDKIRRYFLNDFYKDHVKIYQKRPIYWLLDSGKKDGFKSLFYLHRYDKYTIARTRTDYLHPLQRKYEAEIKRLEMLSGSTDKASEKAAYKKEIETLQGKIEECRVYDQVVAHIAHQQIELDLDDGVKVNYEKFQGVEVPKDNGKFEKMDLLGRY